ncbi:hypothetical protein DFH07DRAFT_1065394 [Mycena maculata]|uniref:Uncharacterized protein n=1 Tax=Mycena maculata TaxID=230809 RepID=A0AAD7I407_9AGAR|nr:hypothetical protein DFH07DRAFT_1065394 [Mycena maculata]
MPHDDERTPRPATLQDRQDQDVKTKSATDWGRLVRHTPRKALARGWTCFDPGGRLAEQLSAWSGVWSRRLGSVSSSRPPSSSVQTAAPRPQAPRVVAPHTGKAPRPQAPTPARHHADKALLPLSTIISFPSGVALRWTDVAHAHKASQNPSSYRRLPPLRFDTLT